MQSDGNFVIYRQGSTRPSDALWSTRTWGHPGMVPKLCPASVMAPGEWLQPAKAWLVMQLDGNMVLFRKRDGAVLRNSHTERKPEVVAMMQDDGNLVLRSGWTMPVWSSGTYNNRGAHATLQDDGNFVIYRHDGSNPSDAVWSTVTWRTAASIPAPAAPDSTKGQLPRFTLVSWPFWRSVPRSGSVPQAGFEPATPALGEPCSIP